MAKDKRREYAITVKKPKPASENSKSPRKLNILGMDIITEQKPKTSPRAESRSRLQDYDDMRRDGHVYQGDGEYDPRIIQLTHPRAADRHSLAPGFHTSGYITPPRLREPDHLAPAPQHGYHAPPQPLPPPHPRPLLMPPVAPEAPVHHHGNVQRAYNHRHHLQLPAPHNQHLQSAYHRDRDDLQPRDRHRERSHERRRHSHDPSAISYSTSSDTETSYGSPERVANHRRRSSQRRKSHSGGDRVRVLENHHSSARDDDHGGSGKILLKETHTATYLDGVKDDRGRTGSRHHVEPVYHNSSSGRNRQSLDAGRDSSGRRHHSEPVIVYPAEGIPSRHRNQEPVILYPEVRPSSRPRRYSIDSTYASEDSSNYPQRRSRTRERIQPPNRNHGMHPHHHKDRDPVFIVREPRSSSRRRQSEDLGYYSDEDPRSRSRSRVRSRGRHGYYH